MNAAGSLFVLLALCAAVPPRAHAQAEHPDKKAAARAHFDRGLAASNEQRFDDAAREFEEAYALSPDFKVLYNIGRVSGLLGRPLRAVEAFEGYLTQGAERISEDRRVEVRRLIDEQRPKLATLGVETQAGADVRVDGRLVGRAPLPQRLRLPAGPHTIEAVSATGPPVIRELTLAGASTTDVTLAFPPVATPPAPRVSLDLERSAEAAPAAPPRNTRRLAGYVAGGVGLVALAVGAVLAYQGATDANAARARLVTAAMPAPPAMPDVQAYDAAKMDYDDAKTRNQLGWAVAGAGGLALVAGVALVLTSPAPRAQVQVVAGRETIGLRGAW